MVAAERAAAVFSTHSVRIVVTGIDRRASRAVAHSTKVAVAVVVASVMAAVAIIASVPAVQHAEVGTTCRTEVLAAVVVITSSSYHMPGMSTTIVCIEHGTSEIEVVAVRIAGIYCKMPITSTPVQRAIEIGSCAESVPLPVKQDVAHV